VGPKECEPGVVDQDVDVAGVFRQTANLRRLAEIRCEEARPPPAAMISSTVGGAALGVAAVDDDLGAVAASCRAIAATDAGGRARDQRLLILEVARLKD